MTQTEEEALSERYENALLYVLLNIDTFTAQLEQNDGKYDGVYAKFVENIHSVHNAPERKNSLADLHVGVAMMLENIAHNISKRYTTEEWGAAVARVESQMENT